MTVPAEAGALSFPEKLVLLRLTVEIWLSGLKVDLSAPRRERKWNGMSEIQPFDGDLEALQTRAATGRTLVDKTGCRLLACVKRR